MMAGLLDEYPMPGLEVDPREMEKAKYLALMRLGLGAASREPLGQAMQGGINTLLASQEEARRFAATRAQMALQQMKYVQEARKDQELSNLLSKFDKQTLQSQFGVPGQVVDIAVATRDPKLIYEYMKPSDLAEGSTRFIGNQPFVVRGKNGTYGQFANGVETGQALQEGAVQNAALMAEAAALGKGRGEAETTLEEVPVIGGKPGQTERVSRAQLLREAAVPQSASPYPLRVPPEVQKERDVVRMSMLEKELADAVAKGNKSDIAALSKEIEIMNNKNVSGLTAVVANRRVKDPVAQREAEARIPTTPSGFHWDGSNLVRTPGGPQDTSEQEQIKIGNAINRADLVIKKVADTKESADWTTVGPASSLLGWAPGTRQYDMKKRVDMLKANIGFQELQAMRAASPTGGALGQVAIQELDMLQSVLGSLDTSQSPEEFKKTLAAVDKHFSNWKRVMQQSGAKFNRGASGDWGEPSADTSVDSLVDKYRSKR